MGIIRLLKPGLFVYECIRILMLAGFIAIQPLIASALISANLAIFPIVVFAAPSVLFLLMALFLWLDITRYRAYLPLYLAGKCLNIVSLLGWSIIVKRITITNVLSGFAAVELLLLCGDLIAIAAVILMLRDIQEIKAEVE